MQLPKHLKHSFRYDSSLGKCVRYSDLSVPANEIISIKLNNTFTILSYYRKSLAFFPTIILKQMFPIMFYFELIPVCYKSCYGHYDI